MKTKFASARGKKISEALRAKYTPEELSARSERRWAGVSTEQKRAGAKKANEGRWVSREQHSAQSKKMRHTIAKLTKAQRRRNAKKAGLASAAKRSPEERRALSKRAGLARIAGLTPEEIKAMSRKAVEALRAKYTPEEWRAMGVKAGNASWASKTKAQRDAFAKRSSERMKNIMAAAERVKAFETRKISRDSPGRPIDKIAKSLAQRHAEMGGPRPVAEIADKLAMEFYPTEFAATRPYSEERRTLRDRVRASIKRYSE
jgi:hypothetical protein